MNARFADTALKAIRAVESYLTTGMFGDGKVIAGNAAAYYRGAARACARATGVDPELLASSDGAVLESLRRAHVDEALRHCMAGLNDQGAAILSAFLDLRERINLQPTEVVRVTHGSSPCFLPVGPDGWLEGFILQRFDDTATIDGARVGVIPVALTLQVDAVRDRAVALARRSVPQLAGDVLAAVRHVVLYQADQPYSGYTTAVPLFVFIASHAFEQEHFAAELLMHESLHQKLTDISIVRSLFRPGYDDSQSATIAVPWSFGRSRTRYFAADRTFAAFHVYSHQAVLYLGMAATAKTTDEVDLAVANAILSWARASHFATAVRGGEISAEFGPDGRRLAAWLTRAVEDIGEFRLPDGTRLQEHRDDYAITRSAATL